MKPRPPICMRHRSTSCPKGVKSLPTLNTPSPVTHTALVLMNRPSTQEIGRVVIPGSMSSSHPTTTRVAKLIQRELYGVRRGRNANAVFLISSIEPPAAKIIESPA